MEFRQLGRSGLKVPALSLGTGTFGGGTEFFRAWGSSDVAEATRLVSICMEAGVNLFDTADVYSAGLSEEILGKAVEGRRQDVLISTKASFRMGKGPNDLGSSRHHLIQACEASLRRLGTDYIDIYHLHGFDALTPVEEVLSTLNQLIESGKVRYVACSNCSGWHLMKSLAASDRYGWPRYVGHQVYYSLIGREYEWELMPLGLDQGVGALVWSPLGWGRLTGKIRRGQPLPSGSRLHQTAENGPPVADEHLYKVVDALEQVARETEKSVPQVALNWLLRRPTISTVIIGARNEEQLRQNLAAEGWSLSPSQIALLDRASEQQPIYPYWHQWQFVERNPLPVPQNKMEDGRPPRVLPLQLHTWPLHERGARAHISLNCFVNLAALHHEHHFFHHCDVPPAGRHPPRQYPRISPVLEFQFHPSVLTTRLHSRSPLAARRSASCLRSPGRRIFSTQSPRRRLRHRRFSDGGQCPP